MIDLKSLPTAGGIYCIENTLNSKRYKVNHIHPTTIAACYKQRREHVGIYNREKLICGFCDKEVVAC